MYRENGPWTADPQPAALRCSAKAGAASWKRWLLLAALLVLLFAMALQPKTAQSQSIDLGNDRDPAETDALKVTEVYKLATGDRLRITVFGHTDVSGEFDVDGNGQINFPLLGPVLVAGRSIKEVRTTIQDNLNRDYLVDPKVSVEVLNFRPFFILGQVNQPGQYPFTIGLNVRQAVALAGGYTRRADTSSMVLIRSNASGITELKAEENTIILPGDTIEIDRRFF
jgi:polysaccharide export outer membrane protein|tara:strand:- start:1700 stop:2377 length:678 start_codon:yes stop_codon:yes gene_type:complete